MNQIEVIFSRTRDDPHDVLVAKRVKDVGDSGNETRGLKQQTCVEGVAFVPQPVNFGRSCTLFFRQMPGTSTLNEEQLDVLLLCEWNAGRTQYVLGCLEVQVFGFDQHAVVIPKDGLYHQDSVEPCAC